MAYELCLTRAFKDDMDQLLREHPELKDKMAKVYRYMEDDPTKYSGSLQTGKLHRASDHRHTIYKSRIDHRFRFLWRYDENGRIFLGRVGDHDFINDFADFTGEEIAQIIRRQAASEKEQKHEQEAERGWQREYDRAARIFGDWQAVHLQLLGVPQDRAREVQLLTDIDALYDLGLPEYATQNLADAYLLEDWDPERTFDSAHVFYRTNADQLEAYCKGEIKQLLLNLSPEQERLVDMQTTGPTLIKGTAGSGKTTVGLYRAMRQTYARNLFSRRKPEVLFITYTETLARAVEQMFVELYGQEKAKRVEVWVLREWLKNYLESDAGMRKLATNGQIDHAVSMGMYEAKRQFPNSALCSRGTDFFRSEIGDVIKGRDLRTWEQYAQARRVGRKHALQEEPRRFVWAVYEEYERQLARKQIWDYLDLALVGAERLSCDPDIPTYDAVVVDEAQDLRPVQLQVVSLLAGGERARNLVLLADPAQSIYYKGIPWKEGNVYIAGGRSFSLARNYRNTREILDAAWSLTKQRMIDDPDEEVIHPDATNRRGPRPHLVLAQDRDFHDRFVVQTIESLCRRMLFRPGDIAVLTRKNDNVNRLLYAISRTGIPVRHFRHDGFDIFENEVKVITINSAKGLEFPVVFLAHLNAGDLPLNLRVESEEELEEKLRGERRLLYVAMTRAASRLYMVCEQEIASPFIEEIDPHTIYKAFYEG